MIVLIHGNFLRQFPKKVLIAPYPHRCLQASLPVQEYLFMPFDQAHKQYETARHLPPPLYVLFVQATAYGQACGKYGAWCRRGAGGAAAVADGVIWKHCLLKKALGPAQTPSGDRCCPPCAPPSMAALTSWPEAGLN